ncbi:hypothetical protein BDM02DRAFT_3124387 [Thelephora ganbajun]|uniref:Uncharacterized protein n=1 Tax=Thelephora ganbajun TaxID=370292 RepID=A0ACB6YZT8_THEGA|nr:hypothetical protein BDM02DRAFT_3124387 [Thelephora ganbajun]
MDLGINATGGRCQSPRLTDKVTCLSRALRNLNRWISIHVVVRTIFSSALAIYLVCGTGAVHRPGSRS